ncbi:MAG: ribulose-phosphate 3-epimerase [Oscillospiraceae bacterium]|nr:ribulose-phosphate 3-epimerase [Oscillospiraceae bacterium]MDD4413474.1 ribulose-phosphate 3-epimerase [Oscillospiraceae bacterium]
MVIKMKVSPSILTCDFARLADEIAFIEQTGADMLHLDVMDGVFVPNLSFGPPVIKRLRPLTGMIFDVHLMMKYPDRLIDAFSQAGADIINIHLECDSPLDKTLEHIRSLGKIAGLTLKPSTPAQSVFPYIDKVGLILVMTVEPGFGGQSFMQDMMPKVTDIRNEIKRRGSSVMLQVDGGINSDTAVIAAKAGADTAVVGNAMFTSENPTALTRQIQAL